MSENNHRCPEKPDHVHIYKNTKYNWVLVNDKNRFDQDILYPNYCPYCGERLL